LDEAGFVGETTACTAVAEVAFLGWVVDVGLDGRVAHEEHVRDFGIRVSACDEPEHVSFPLGQLVQWARRGLAGWWSADELFDEPAGDGGREQCVAGGDGGDGVGGAVAGIAAARGGSSRTITIIVPLAQVQAHDPTRPAPPYYSRETWAPNSSQVVRQDQVGFVNFGAGTFLGTITRRDGQIVYAATTKDQDNTTYAILGGSGAYATARGTVTLHALDARHVRVTIRVTSEDERTAARYRISLSAGQTRFHRRVDPGRRGRVFRRHLPRR